MSRLLLHSPADIVRYLLIDAGYGTLPVDSGDWPILIGIHTDTPDRQIALFEEVGTDDGRNMITGTPHEHPGVQVSVRGHDYQESYAKIQAVAVYLDSVSFATVTIASTSYTVQAFTRQNNCVYLGQEKPETRRNMWVFSTTMTVLRND